MNLKQEMNKWKNSFYFSLILAIFFCLPFFHEWTKTFMINLHFCTHLYCMIFSAIFFGFAYFSQKKKKSYLNMIFIVAIVGVVLMNMTYCVDGEIFFIDKFSIIEESILVPLPPCFETDDGMDYITFGAIRSGVDLDDFCMGADRLRERYCDTELTYTSVDISCSARFGELWHCADGECVEGEEVEEVEEEVEEGGIETDCGDGIDNDGDLAIDCADSDCDYDWLEGGCGDFDYSCEHNPTNPYPFCGGTCPTGSYCGDYSMETSSWCECIPEEEISCVDSTGDGWCEEGYICVEDGGEYYCEYDFGTCYDTDGGEEPLIGGFIQVSYPEFPEWGTLNIIEYCLWEKGMENILQEYFCVDGEDSYKDVDCTDYGLCCVEDSVDGSYCGECEY